VSIYSSKKQSDLVTACFLLRWYGLNSKPYGVNYLARYSLCLRIGPTWAWYGHRVSFYGSAFTRETASSRNLQTLCSW